MTCAFKDHFSGHADAYARSRPNYPAQLFDWLATQCAEHTLAVDVGCGNGQAALQLARHFDAVHAFDPSAAQLANATVYPHVHYAVAPAEHIPLNDASVDLLFVAQAMHWFDFPRFFAEVERLLKPGARFCAVHYPLLRVAPWMDRHIEHFELDTLANYWLPERRHIDNAFCEVRFPFPRLATPAFIMRHHWTLPRLLDYIRTWSAVQRYTHARGFDPVLELGEKLTPMWGEPEQERIINWPLHVWTGIKS
jgi:SAM-dependent methyltransferase